MASQLRIDILREVIISCLAKGFREMASLSFNLKTLMSLAKINASELARRTGIAQPIIHRLSTGQNTNPKLSTLKPIARYFSVNISQLIGEELLPNEVQKETPKPILSHVPLISWRDAISWTSSFLQYKNSGNLTYVSTDANVSKLAYSLMIKDCAMEPLFPEGTTIIVEPNREPRDKDFVVILFNGESEARLKQIIINGTERYLKTLNIDIKSIKMTRLTQEDQFLGVMTQAKVNY